MDQVLINNWNYTVRPDDCVIYVGDLCCSRDKDLTAAMLKQLNGKIIFIAGNHDEGTSLADTRPFIILRYRDTDFLFTHYPGPTSIPDGFDGWIIHGHSHNSDF